MSEQKQRVKISQCHKRWFTLHKIQGTTEVRYCEQCSKGVHWCNTESDLIEAIQNNWCVAAENKLVYPCGETQKNERPVKTDIETNFSPIVIGEPKSPYIVGEYHGDKLDDSEL